MTIPIPTTRVTLEDFKVFIARPENEGRLFEFINGEITEVMPGRTLISEVSHVIAFEVRLFCLQHDLPCHISGEAGAYEILGQTAVPDFAYKQTPMSMDYLDPVPPLLVVEVISPTDEPNQIRDKRNLYLRAGILQWEVYEKSMSVDVYETGKPPRTISIDDELDGGDVLPGFRLPVRKLFSR